MINTRKKRKNKNESIESLKMLFLGSAMAIGFSAMLIIDNSRGNQDDDSEKNYHDMPAIIWEDNSNENPMLPALVHTESRGNPDAVSKKGAAGMFQIMPATARNPGYGVTPLRWWNGKDPRTAPIHEQRRFANDLLNAYQAHHGGNPVLAAASYNAGAGAVSSKLKKAKGNIHKAITLLPAETQSYVVKVAGYKGPAQQVASLPPITYRYSPFDALGGALICGNCTIIPVTTKQMHL